MSVAVTFKIVKYSNDLAKVYVINMQKVILFVVFVFVIDSYGAVFFTKLFANIFYMY